MPALKKRLGGSALERNRRKAPSAKITFSLVVG
jgi:hypothetical protein